MSYPNSLNAFTKFDSLSVTVETICSRRSENSLKMSCNSLAIQSYECLPFIRSQESTQLPDSNVFAVI